MTLTIESSIAPHMEHKEGDVRAVKTALNKLGYYTPDFNKGMSDEADSEFFEAVKNFQRCFFITADGYLDPNDVTIRHINQELKNPDNFMLFKSHYIWRTVGDEKVRGNHRAREGQSFSWEDPPEGGHPGEDYNCRCWTEPIVPMQPKGLNFTLIQKPALDPMQDAIRPSLSPLDFIGGVGIIFSKITIRVGEKTTITYTKKGIEKQLVKRGWTKKSIKKTIEKPNKTVSTKDIRRRKNGMRKNEPATAYINKDGSYVVRNNKTGDIVQVSDKKKPDWKSPFKNGE